MSHFSYQYQFNQTVAVCYLTYLQNSYSTLKGGVHFFLSAFVVPIAACIVLGVMFMRPKGANKNYFNGYIIFIGIFNVNFFVYKHSVGKRMDFCLRNTFGCFRYFRVICLLYTLNNISAVILA